MSINNTNGKWQIAFFLTGVICLGWLGWLTTSVIANDRLRENNELSIRQIIQVQYSEIIQRLTRIEEKIGINR